MDLIYESKSITNKKILFYVDKYYIIDEKHNTKKIYILFKRTRYRITIYQVLIREICLGFYRKFIKTFQNKHNVH